MNIRNVDNYKGNIMKNYKIAVIAGDGTGPEVINEGLKVLAAAGQKFGFQYQTQAYDFGGARYLRTKEILPDSAIGELKTFDAIYLVLLAIPTSNPAF